jgi:hypothetical protein
MDDVQARNAGSEFRSFRALFGTQMPLRQPLPGRGQTLARPKTVCRHKDDVVNCNMIESFSLCAIANGHKPSGEGQHRFARNLETADVSACSSHTNYCNHPTRISPVIMRQ